MNDNEVVGKILPSVEFTGERPTNAVELPQTEAAAVSLILAGGQDGPEAWERAEASRVTCESFSHPTLRIIFSAARDVAEHGQIPDAVSISERLAQRQQLDVVGGAERLEEMIKQAPAPYQIDAVFTRIEDAARRRRILRHAENLAAMAKDPDVSVNDVERHASESPDFAARQRKLTGSIGEFLSTYPEERPALIDGFVRPGDVAVFVASSKAGKTWLSHAMVLEFLRSGTFLDHFQCYGAGKRALICDMELHPQTLATRLHTVAGDLGVDLRQMENRLLVESMRNEDGPNGFDAVRAKVQRHRADLVVVDALYTAYPDDPRFSENDNASMGRLIRHQFGKLARETGSAIILIHHLSKGGQSDKASVDLGAGAGALMRAVDAQLAIRPHEESGCFVIDGNLRSFAPIEPFVVRRVVGDGIRWEVAADLDPTRLEGRRQTAGERAEDRQKRSRDIRRTTADEHDAEVMQAMERPQLSHTWSTQTTIAGCAKLNNANTKASLARLVSDGLVVERPRDGRTTEYLLKSYSEEVAEKEKAARVQAEAERQQTINIYSTPPSTPSVRCPEQREYTEQASGQPDNQDCPLSGAVKTSVKRAKRSRADKVELSGVTHSAGSTSSTAPVAPAAEGWL